MSIDDIRTLLNDIESDRVERTISTTNTDKFGQAICAFANDLPDHRLPGYLFLGVTDDGVVNGINVTDDLLKNVAAIRTDGNIQPQPSMTVEKVAMPEGDIVMVRVEPSIFPPFAKNLRRFIPGAYIQYVRFAGKDRAGDIMTEHEFKRNLCTTLEELDTFVETTIVGVSERTIQRAIDDLKELGYINKEHSKIKGEWQLLK